MHTKINILTLLIFLVIYSPLLAQMNSRELSELKLNGKVKTIKKTSYKAILEGNNIIKVQKETMYPSAVYDFTANYDKNGNIIEEVRYDSSDEIKSKVEYKYNKYGIERKNIFIFYTNDVLKKEYVKNKYDANGYITESIYGNNKYVYKYDEKGNKVTNHWIHDTITKKYRTLKYKYDINNNQIEESDYSMENKLLRKETDLFDSIGNNIEHVWYENWNFFGEEKFRIIMVTNMAYNENNDVIKKIWKKRKDTNRHLTEEEYVYTYDKRNNWINKIVKKKSGIYSYSDTEKNQYYIIERKIEYYDK